MAYNKFLTVAGNELFNEDGEKVAEFNKDRIEYDSSKIGGGGGSADSVSFDPSLTELVATNVQNAIEEVADESHLAINTMTANDGLIFMDYHDGQYGYNTDERRGADTFHPFKSGGGIPSTITELKNVPQAEGVTYSFSNDYNMVVITVSGENFYYHDRLDLNGTRIYANSHNDYLGTFILFNIKQGDTINISSGNRLEIIGLN